MKLSKTAWLILGIGIFVIAFISLYMVYSQQQGEQSRLNDDLLAAQATLPGVVAEKEAQESQLAQRQSELTQLESGLTEATALLESAKMKVPSTVESIEYDERLFTIAYSWGLEITRLTASKPSDQKVESITFSTTTFVVQVKGEVADILDFISTIATDANFNSATVKLVSINVPGPLTKEEKEDLSEEEIEELEAQAPEATITITIYGYKGEGE